MNKSSSGMSSSSSGSKKGLYSLFSQLQTILPLLLAAAVLLLWWRTGQQEKAIDARLSQHIEDSHRKISSFIDKANLQLRGDGSEKKVLPEPKVDQLHSTANSHNVQIDYSSLPKKRESMHDIGQRTGTDKVRHHGYDRFYPFFLESLRELPIKMLEIGYLLGDSYAMWYEYFPKGEVHFMEKDSGAMIHEKTGFPARFTGDQGNIDDLQRMLKEKRLSAALDFIIDDGSHHPEHQKISFKFLFEFGLKPGGIYIIEDTEMNYWVQGETYGRRVDYGKDHPSSIITYFKQLVDVVNREYAPAGKPYTSEFGEYIDSWASSVYFGPNFVIITKMTADEKKRFGDRRYRLAKNLSPAEN